MPQKKRMTCLPLKSQSTRFIKRVPPLKVAHCYCLQHSMLQMQASRKALCEIYMWVCIWWNYYYWDKYHFYIYKLYWGHSIISLLLSKPLPVILALTPRKKWACLLLDSCSDFLCPLTHIFYDPIYEHVFYAIIGILFHSKNWVFRFTAALPAYISYAQTFALCYL